jgi:hypothetical protein
MSTAFYPGLPFSYQYNSVGYVPQSPYQITILVPQYVGPISDEVEKEQWNQPHHPFFQPYLSVCGEIEIAPEYHEVSVATQMVVAQPKRSIESKEKANNYIQIVDFESEEEITAMPTIRALAKDSYQLKIIDEEEAEEDQIEICSTAAANSLDFKESKSIDSEMSYDNRVTEPGIDQSQSSPQQDCETWFSEISTDVFA